MTLLLNDIDAHDKQVHEVGDNIIKRIGELHQHQADLDKKEKEQKEQEEKLKLQKQQ